MKIVIAPDSFKEALPAEAVAGAIARGVCRVQPQAIIDMIPMADGGEGTVNALIAATRGEHRQTTATGPTGEPVAATWGMLGDGSGTAVLEMASASGLTLVPPERRNPLQTTTYGTGELIRAALDHGASQILIGIGGSATNDGGAGAAQAVGVRFLNKAGDKINTPLTGGRLVDVAGIDLRPRDLRIGVTPIRTACDVENPLCGPRGAAAIYAPQKGATPEQVKILDHNLAHLAGLIKRDLGQEVRDLPGAGAAGGLGAGLVAFFGATLQPGIDLVMAAVHLAERIAGADLVITGEGRIDRQSMMGKVIAGVGRTARAAGVRTIALVGAVGEGADETLAVIERYHAINPPDLHTAQALPRTALNLETTTVSVLQKWLRTHAF